MEVKAKSLNVTEHNRFLQVSRGLERASTRRICTTRLDVYRADVFTTAAPRNVYQSLTWSSNKDANRLNYFVATLFPFYSLS